MKDIFSADFLNKSAKRWKKIDAEAKSIQKKLDSSNNISNNELSKLLLLLVEHLRPMNPSAEDLSEVTNKFLDDIGFWKK